MEKASYYLVIAIGAIFLIAASVWLFIIYPASV